MKINIIIALLISSVITFLAMNQEGAKGLPVLIVGLFVMTIHILLIMIKHIISSYKGKSNFNIRVILKEMGIVVSIYLLINILGVFIENS